MSIGSLYQYDEINLTWRSGQNSCSTNPNEKYWRIRIWDGMNRYLRMNNGPKDLDNDTCTTVTDYDRFHPTSLSIEWIYFANPNKVVCIQQRDWNQ